MNVNGTIRRDLSQALAEFAQRNIDRVDNMTFRVFIRFTGVNDQRFFLN